MENRDAFYAYFALHPQRYTLPEPALHALVIYRGDGDESKGRKALREACLLAGKNLIYFGDYDSAGTQYRTQWRLHAYHATRRLMAICF